MKSFSELCRSASRGWDKYQLEQLVGKNIQLMEGHKQSNLPTGHTFYGILWGEVNMAIQRYCDEYKVPFDSVCVGVPKLRELKALANGEHAGVPTAAYPIGALAFGLMLTVYFAGCHDLYMYLTHWVR